MSYIVDANGDYHTVQDAETAVAEGKLVRTSDGYYNKWTRETYWHDGTKRS